MGAVALPPISSTLADPISRNVQVRHHVLDQDDRPSKENIVSVVTVLCGSVPCPPKSINNVRLMDHPTDSIIENSDNIFDPFYHPESSPSPTASPTSDSNSNSVNNNAHMAMNNNQQVLEKPNSNLSRNIGIGISLTIAVLAFTIFCFVRRYKRRRRHLQLSDPDMQSDNSDGNPSPLITPVPTNHASSEGHRLGAIESPPSRHTTMHRYHSDHSTSTMDMSPFASPPPLPSRANSRPEMAQLHRSSRFDPSIARPPLPLRAASHSASQAYNYYPQPPPLVRQSARQRTNTFSDIPADDLPPYVDPIEEALSSANGMDTETTQSPHPTPTESQSNPPPYHAIATPSRAETTH
ncbi:hypothetical protein GGI25_000573 [Coemansia spiralis]|uniref:Uncharacterized protein n=2 Tax=Coemansia TaxID=4863 RepID=A0A9W8L100_9FUNG|nr:hypothetical protein EDC05_000402 [Coemansia umbellata]KAJ2625475.1 hypothetical protein GGI26_000615 [Coemansia sp. RSA 1358]KAJ2680600.1 hypothetical protein GGI25_000573 [Coemansia spiralis]